MQKIFQLKRKIIVLLFAVFFGIISPLLLTDSIIENLNNLRRSYLLSKNQSSKTIEIATNKWNALSDKQEIFYNNQYYDVQKVVQNKTQTIVTIVQDDFESLVKNSLTKNSKQKTKNKKPNTFLADYCIKSSIEKEVFSYKSALISQFLSYSTYNTFLFFNTKPPIF